MFSILPPLLAYSGLSAFILRLTLGSIFIHWGYIWFKKKNKEKTISLAILEIIIGVLLFLGLFTQISAVITTIILGIKLFGKFKNKLLFTDGVNYYFILFIISVSLIFLGAGIFAIDLPL